MFFLKLANLTKIILKTLRFVGLRPFLILGFFKELVKPQLYNLQEMELVSLQLTSTLKHWKAWKALKIFLQKFWMWLTKNPSINWLKILTKLMSYLIVLGEYYVLKCFYIVDKPVYDLKFLVWFAYKWIFKLSSESYLVFPRQRLFEWLTLLCICCFVCHEKWKQWISYLFVKC